MRTRSVRTIQISGLPLADASGPGWFAKYVPNGRFQIYLTMPGARWVSLQVIPTSTAAPQAYQGIGAPTGQLGSTPAEINFLGPTGATGAFGGAFSASYTVPEG